MPRGRKPKIQSEEVKQEVPEASPTPIEAEKITEQPVAVATATFSRDKVLQIERQGESSLPGAKRFPSVRGGICEFCGIVDSKTPSQFQSTLCKHYAGMEIKCSYCPAGTKWEEILPNRTFTILEYPRESGKLVVVCDDLRCRDKHFKRFQTANI